jgi:hypothetical protein
MEPSKAHELAGGKAQSGLYRSGNPVQYRDREELICSGDGRDVKESDIRRDEMTGTEMHVISTSTADGPNGPVMPIIREILPDAPIAHPPGEINAKLACF